MRDNRHTMEKRVKGFGLLSGGLDSILAAKVLQEQGIDVECISFKTPFFGPEKALMAGRRWGIPVRVMDITVIHLEMLRKPVYGYGGYLNPCIDCHGLMFREAGRVMEREGGDFLFSGEVLGQRPMSQRRDAMRSVEKLSGYPGLVLRPLSARLLQPTLVEEDGRVDRERLLDIQGRSRKRQMELADHFGITDYPQPGGGCLLTNDGFVKKLKALFATYPLAEGRQIECLKYGRQFVLPRGHLCVLGRHRRDNETLERLAGPEDILVTAMDRPGPVGLVIAPPDLDDLMLSAELVVAYSDTTPDGSTRVEWRRGDENGILESVQTVARERFRDVML